MWQWEVEGSVWWWVGPEQCSSGVSSVRIWSTRYSIIVCMHHSHSSDLHYYTPKEPFLVQIHALVALMVVTSENSKMPTVWVMKTNWSTAMGDKRLVILTATMPEWYVVCNVTYTLKVVTILLFLLANPPPQLPPPTPCDCSTDCPFDCRTDCPPDCSMDCPPNCEYTECPEPEPAECTAPTTDMANITTPPTSATTHPPPSSEDRPTDTCTCAPPAEDTPLSPGVSGEGQQSRTDSCTAIGGGLGALAVVLVLTLVGVVLGWVWHCHRNKGKANIQRWETSHCSNVYNS